MSNLNSMHTWHWQSWEGLPYLTCSLLDQWPHGFFTRSFSPRTPIDLVEVLHNSASVYRVKQVHGNRVLKTTELLPQTSSIEADSELLCEADGILTSYPSEAVWVATADCTPVLIADSETGNVAAIHAGWRGTAAKIVPEAIAQFQAQGSKISNLRIALGPAVSGDVYQVSQDVAVQLAATVTLNSPQASSTELLERVFELPDSPLLPDSQPDKVRLDVRKFNCLQLEQLGITPEQIAVAPHCTYQEPETFFSYRRDNLKKVQWSGIVSLLTVDG